MLSDESVQKELTHACYWVIGQKKTRLLPSLTARFNNVHGKP